MEPAIKCDSKVMEPAIKECKCKLCGLGKEIEQNKTTNDEVYSKYKFTYDSIKESGILYTKKLLLDNKLSTKLDLIQDIKKMDDPCDAFLHAYKI
jgi:hypothetical protein